MRLSFFLVGREEFSSYAEQVPATAGYGPPLRAAVCCGATLEPLNLAQAFIVLTTRVYSLTFMIGQGW
jgi:hypothetical protein